MSTRKDGFVYRCSAEENIEDEFSNWPPDVSYNWFAYAKTALSSYQKHQGADFLLVGLYPYTCKEILIPEIDETGGEWIHISFLAVPKGSDADDAASHKLFFAELVRHGSLWDTQFTGCFLLDGDDTEVTYSCGICDPSERIPHPVSGYRMGIWPYKDGEVPGCEYGKKRMKSSDFAKIALDLHETGEEWELVKGLGHDGRICLYMPEKGDDAGTWIHVSFTAKHKDADAPQLCFAELYKIGSTEKWSLSMFCIMEPGANHGCGICDPKREIYHPPDFIAGHWPYSYAREYAC